MTLLCLDPGWTTTFITGTYAELPYKIYVTIVEILDIFQMRVRCALGPRVIRHPFEPPSMQLPLVTLEHPLWPDLPHRCPDLMETGLSGTCHSPAITSTMESVSTETVVSRISVTSAPGLTRLQNARDDFHVEFSPLPQSVVLPVNTALLEFYLAEHPNRRLVTYILQGFKFGFDIGFCW